MVKAKLNYFNTLSNQQCDALGIDPEEAQSVLKHYNSFGNGMFEVDAPDIDTCTSLRLDSNGDAQVAYHIYKGGRKVKEMVNRYEDARQVYHRVSNNS